MAPTTKLGPENDKEKAEFDNIRYDEIKACKDVKKLMRMEAYLRDECFASTADAVLARLRELGQRTANAEGDPEQARLLAEERTRASAEVAAWAVKQRRTDVALEAASKEGGSGIQEGGMPPIRAPVRLPTGDAKPTGASASKPAAAKPKGDSGVGTKARSGREYYEAWEHKAQAALAEVDGDDSGNLGTSRAPAGAAASAASTAGLARSPELTNRLLDLNRTASTAERLCLSSVEKSKGNDHFRAKEYEEAVEHYTLALGLRGTAGEASLFGNRAAAYIKLKMWDAVEQDASAALELEPKMVKCYLRRAMARLELGRLAEVVVDCDTALALQPDCKEAQGMRERAAKLLQEAGMKRMAIVEVEDDEEEHTEDCKVSQVSEPTPKPQEQQQTVLQEAAAPGPRKKLVVVEETESSEDGEEEDSSEAAVSEPAYAPVTQLPPPQPQAIKQGPQSVEAPVSSSIAAVSNGDLKVSAAPPAAATTAPPAVATSEALQQPCKQAAPPPSPLQQPPFVDFPPEPSPPLSTDPSQFDAFVEKIKQEGNKEFKSCNFVRAAQLYSEALELAPDLAFLYLNRSMARLSSGLPVEALKDACQAVALDPHSYKAYNKRARAKEQLRLWKAARDDMQRCLELVPAKEDKISRDVAQELARATGHVEAAQSRVAQRAAAAAARGPQRVKHYAKAGVTIEEHHDDKDASEEDKPLMPAEEVDELEAAAVRRLPRMRTRAGELRANWLQQRDAEAREVYQRELLAWQAAKERAEAVAAAAATAAASAKEEVAASVKAPAAEASAVSRAMGTVAKEVALSTSPALRSLESIKAEGNEHLNARRHSQAEKCYQECLQLDAGNLPVRLNLLVLLNAMERWLEAEAVARQALELIAANRDSLTSEQQSNMRSKVHHRRAQALKAQGRYQEALEDLRAARALFGQSPTLDHEMEEVGRLLVEQRGTRVATQVAAAAVVPQPTSIASDVRVPALIVDEAVPGVREKATPAVGAPVAVPPGATATVGTPEHPGANSSSGGGGGMGPGPAPRRRMQVQVETDSEDDEDGAEGATASSLPRPAASLAQPTPASAVPVPSQTLSMAPTPKPTAVPALITTTASATPAPSTSSATAIPAVQAPTPSTASARAPTSTPAGAAAKSGGACGGGGKAQVSGDPGDEMEASRLRDEGNRLFSVGNYVRAMDFYSRSIRACTHNPAAYCNRSFVYLHLRRPADALLDAEAAIEQSGGSYPKAKLRRALALRDLGRITEAMAVVRELLNGAPGDAALLEEMQRLQHMAAKQGNGNAAAKNIAIARGDVPPPVQAPPVRHKIVVEEVSSDDDDDDDEEARAPTKATERQVSTDGSAKTVACSPPSTSTSAPPSSPVLPSPAALSTERREPSSSASKPPLVSAPMAAATNGGSHSSGAGSRNSVEVVASAKAAAALAVVANAPKKPKPPKSAHELEQALKSVAGNPALQYEYLRLLNPTSYPDLIKANLSPQVVQAIVESARQALRLTDGSETPESVGSARPADEEVDFALKSLECLTRVPRFDVTYGMCGRGLKENVRAISHALAAAGRDVAWVKKSYKL